MRGIRRWRARERGFLRFSSTKSSLLSSISSSMNAEFRLVVFIHFDGHNVHPFTYSADNCFDIDIWSVFEVSFHSMIHCWIRILLLLHVIIARILNGNGNTNFDLKWNLHRIWIGTASTLNRFVIFMLSQLFLFFFLFVPWLLFVFLILIKMSLLKVIRWLGPGALLLVQILRAEQSLRQRRLTAVYMANCGCWRFSGSLKYWLLSPDIAGVLGLRVTAMGTRSKSQTGPRLAAFEREKERGRSPKQGLSPQTGSDRVHSIQWGSSRSTMAVREWNEAERRSLRASILQREPLVAADTG